MIADLAYGLLLFAFATNLASTAYVLMAIRQVGRFRPRRPPARTFCPPVTVLKPVCGLDAYLYENLRSFCVQDYPEFQIVFGVRDSHDPAIPLIQRLISEFPGLDLALVVDPRIAGPNLKVSNLANMVAEAKHAFLIIADSDMRVEPAYLASVVAPFEDAKVGAVTCLYSGTPVGGLASRLGSMFINEWFLPSVLVNAGLSEIRYALGATIAVRLELLDGIGGFEALSRYLADDHILGKLISARGYRVVLSDYVVENVVQEKNLLNLFRHELRWSQTVRACEPLGHAFSFLMYGVPLALIAALVVDATLDWEWFGAGIVALAVGLRVLLHLVVSRKLGLAGHGFAVWLVPVRDVLCFLVWAASYFFRTLTWRDMTFTVTPDGFIHPTKGTSHDENPVPQSAVVRRL